MGNKVTAEDFDESLTNLDLDEISLSHLRADVYILREIAIIMANGFKVMCDMRDKMPKPLNISIDMNLKKEELLAELLNRIGKTK